ncbi:MAG: hypothetical protein AB1Z18_05680 [Desulfobacterales bacterium]|jgi:hypothetical protein
MSATFGPGLSEIFVERSLAVLEKKFAILIVEAPVRQGVNKKEYLDIPIFRTGSRTGCIGVLIWNLG